MDSTTFNKFQDSVSKVLVRHKSILDVVTKYQESCAKVNRAVVKSATSCGCIKISAEKQNIPDDASYEELHGYMSTHLNGAPCDVCRDKIEKEIGNHLFYLAALCNTLELELDDILKNQLKNIDTLGKYSLY
ncbi:DUF1573 domain-containing protein [Geosporobacter ferrireducens]|uniref:DUF1573 domain-containing protein n=1 Tax=Geosporobacter ferrireducens TaxID=1424294 RepID=A0A1D8GJN9_9FIRM|nr:DUF1573 domain-containing protein [Geosporobacter ferrireducens]AOT71125.1 DUF1573 domain-containing protein [Geosporobacter ferrireducens]MTI57933.1 DUF1573 domain-containing protein [Geosporobacter ferrireducens]